MVERFRPRAAGIEADLLYSVGEVAKHYKVHPVTIHRWIKVGRLRRVRVGPNTTRIPGASIIANQQA